MAKQPKTPAPLTMSVEEAAILIGVSRMTAYGLARRGELPLLPLGGRKRGKYRVLRIPLERLLRGENSPDAAA